MFMRATWTMIRVVHTKMSALKPILPELIQPQMKVQIPQETMPTIPWTAPAF